MKCVRGHQLNRPCIYIMYLLDWVGGPDGKIFGSEVMTYGPSTARSVLHDREPNIFPVTARPNSVNKHFIIWPLWSLFLCFLVVFSFGGRRAALFRAYFQGANDIALFMWESGFQNTQKLVKIQFVGFNFDKMLCEKFTFSLKKNTQSKW